MSQYNTAVTGNPSVPTTFATANGNAVPAANVITFTGVNGIVFSGSGSTVTATFNDSLSRASGIYGDGSDGSPTWDGSTVVLGITPSASSYTLTRDIYLGSSTINIGISIITNGFRIFCNGTLTNNGIIKWNGNDGTNLGVAGAAVNNTNSSIQDQTAANASPGLAGGAGNTGAGTAATNSAQLVHQVMVLVHLELLEALLEVLEEQ